MTQFFQVLASGADSFMNLFRAGGQQFVGFVTDIVPLLVALLVTMNAIINFIGTDRVERLAKKMFCKCIY